ncbi:methyltransferase [Caulobacter phage CcrColossus]|uniref:Putative methyltransferase n=1 Tax=Caulobacter phage CcrColossus TaxID=1211640 RepID=K4JV11_9CAUD|nr:methyltransferase [Caulobacter phage CcrColossus]AFU88200.1 putative methyltransferase [Caulobacter phage CcrColossus]
MATYEAHKPRLVDVPEGVSGNWRVEKFFAKRSASSIMDELRGRGLPEGEYTRLANDTEDCFMSDTPAEYRDAMWFIGAAKGDILISGLGLGMVVKALLKKPEITSITVLELSEDVIKLVAPSYPDPRVRIIHADCRTWKADRKFDYAWHDIWAEVSLDDLPEMQLLRRRYAKAMKASQRQHVWGEDLIKRSRW